jgi:hypothetical protein
MLTLRCEFTYGIHVERVEQGEHDVLDSMHDGGDLLELFFYCRRIPLQAKCSSTARCTATSRMAYTCAMVTATWRSPYHHCFVVMSLDRQATL